MIEAINTDGWGCGICDSTTYITGNGYGYGSNNSLGYGYQYGSCYVGDGSRYVGLAH